MGLAPRHAPLRLGLSYFAPKSSRQPANRNGEDKRQSNCPPAKESSARAKRASQAALMSSSDRPGGRRISVFRLAPPGKMLLPQSGISMTTSTATHRREIVDKKRCYLNERGQQVVENNRSAVKNESKNPADSNCAQGLRARVCPPHRCAPRRAEPGSSPSSKSFGRDTTLFTVGQSNNLVKAEATCGARHIRRELSEVGAGTIKPK